MESISAIFPSWLRITVSVIVSNTQFENSRSTSQACSATSFETCSKRQNSKTLLLENVFQTRVPENSMPDQFSDPVTCVNRMGSVAVPFARRDPSTRIAASSASITVTPASIVRVAFGRIVSFSVTETGLSEIVHCASDEISIPNECPRARVR